MELRYPLILTLLAACSTVDDTTTQTAAQTAHPFSLDDQRAAVAARDAERKAAYVPNLRSKIAPVEWIAHAYHGLVTDANFDPLVFDAAIIDAIQTSIFDELYPSTAQAAMAKYGEDLAVLFAAKNTNPRERAEARATAIDGLLSVASPEQIERLRWRADVVRGGIAETPWQYKISEAVLEWIRTYGISIWTPPPGQAYLDECAAQGVPIPPDWPSDEWRSQGVLAFTFLGRETHVFTYRDPASPNDGICFALPRYETDGALALNGIICQNKLNGKACFWDNITRDNTRRLGRADYPLRIGSIGDGYTLAENCTSCHRGDNVFNIHPGTALDQPDTAAFERYTPIGRDYFINPPPLAMPVVPAGQQSCTGCHTLPSLGSQYCSSVLAPAARVTMPKRTTETMWRPAGWPPGTLRADYSTHINWLKDACP